MSILINLEEYMLTQDTINRSLQCLKKDIIKESSEVKKSIEEKKDNKNKNNFFIPKEKDTLFWCYYIIKYGFSKYEYPGSTSFVNEKAEKFALIESMRLKKHILKSNKIKNIKEDVEDELANKQKIGMKTFIALCASENINVLFIHKRKCFHFLSGSLEKDDSVIYHVIHQYDKPERYCYELNTTAEQWTRYKTDFFHWETLEKPLKAISSYKVDELTDICKQLGLSTDTKKNKKDLYELILMNL